LSPVARGPILNPLHCGAVVASRPVRGEVHVVDLTLNPLHCGAVVASQGEQTYEPDSYS